MEPSLPRSGEWRLCRRDRLPSPRPLSGSGYATAGTDTGHFADGIDARWALHHPEKITDFGWRGVHQMTVQAKAVLAAFYGAPATHNYFASCSDGGREALMEAQRFPADYDGIVAGAPAYNWTALLTSGAIGMQALLAGDASYIPASKIPLLSISAVVAHCDKIDGVSDGIIADPRACHFNAAELACKSGPRKSCLTPLRSRLVTLILSEQKVGDTTIPAIPAGRRRSLTRTAGQVGSPGRSEANPPWPAFGYRLLREHGLQRSSLGLSHLRSCCRSCRRAAENGAALDAPSRPQRLSRIAAAS